MATNTLPLERNERARRAVGALLWCLCLQFFVAEQLVRNGWTTPYSWANNYISDLGAVECANRPPNSDRFVCSPLHTLMNGSFILQGLLIAGGAALNPTALPAGRLRTATTTLFIAAGAGVIAVGFAPVDVHLAAHYAGAGVHFIAGNLGMILFGTALRRSQPDRALPRPFALLARLAGGIGLTALLLLAAGYYAGLGAGGMERVVAYPLPLLLAGVGAFLLFRRAGE